MTQSKRRTRFIKKEFQTRFIIKFCLILLAGIVLSTGLTVIFSQDTLTSSFENSRLVIENTGTAILPTIILTNLITLGIITLAAIGVTLFISHKIAGPLFRFETDLKKIGKGDLSLKVNLRKEDQFFDLADSINEMTQGLNQKVGRIRNGLDELGEAEQDLPPYFEEKLARIKADMDVQFKL